MWSISRCDINKKIARNVDVSLRGFVQKLAPIRRRQGIPAFPPPDPLFGHSKIRCELLPAPRPDNFSIAVHAKHYGEPLHYCQGESLQCILWINPPHYSS